MAALRPTSTLRRTLSNRLFTSESVTDGHPDKIADQISDAVLDAVLAEDPEGRVAAETLVNTGMVVVAGEITSTAEICVPAIVRNVVRKAGYDRPEYGFDGDSCAVVTAIDKQSREIGKGVDGGGAGDQGMMFGYASDETPELMPAPIACAHALVQRLSEARRGGEIEWLRPDGKSQVTFEYEGDGPAMRPARVKAVVLSAQHGDVDVNEVKRRLRKEIVEPVLADKGFELDDAAHCHVNPAGSFKDGGPKADAGMTGRKIIVDTYGGMGRHGGGAFSGKDATKVDRSGAYAARWAAKNLVAAGAASRCEVQLAYAIGRCEPLQVYVDSFGTGKLPDGDLSKAVSDVFDFTPAGIIDALGLRAPVFGPTATFGHFGRKPKKVERHGRQVRLFSWERINRVDDLRKALDL